MKVLNFGSINIDHVYIVPHFVRPGETLPATDYSRFAGGKGLNQSVAAARAGAKVWHAGKVGPDAGWVLDELRASGVDPSLVAVGEEPTGHAMIQIGPDGQNAITLWGGANRSVGPAELDRALAPFGRGDFLIAQNEVNYVRAILRDGKERGLRIVFNPAPMTEDVTNYPLDVVDYLVVNETEGAGLSGEREPAAILGALAARCPAAAVVLTLGERGAIYRAGAEQIEVPAVKVAAIDTTAAGDTFVGYFVAGLVRGLGVREALDLASRAAAICVTRRGAARSIPTLAEVAG